jgi:methylglutaconyl-CoA hydratase
MIQTTIQGAIATVTLNRPDVRNAFNDETIAALTQTFTELGGNDIVRCIVLAANGKAFCAGADLHWMRRMADYSHAENVADAMGLATMLNTIYTCPKPVVARVQGACFAGGVGRKCDVLSK